MEFFISTKKFIIYFIELLSKTNNIRPIGWQVAISKGTIIDAEVLTNLFKHCIHLIRIQIIQL